MYATSPNPRSTRVKPVKRVRVGALFVATSALAALLGGCSSGTDDDGDNASKLAAPSTSCDGSPVYQGFLREGSACADVPGVDGTWKASPLFPNAPASVKKAACSYYWTPSTATANAPDKSALTHVDGKLSPKCVPPVGTSSRPGLIYPSLTAAEVEVPGADTGEGGTQGCDVCVNQCTDCAMVEGESAYLILPPGFTSPQVVEVETSAQMKEFIHFTPPPGGPQSYSVKLPDLPDGQSYVEGFTHVY